MTVYADILIITNLIVDYFLLAATGKIIRYSPPLLRQLSAAFLASLSTLIIFLPQQNAIIELLLRTALSYIICFICFGYRSFRRFVFSGAVFFAVTFAYAGGMMAVWHIFKPHGMAINNSVVYFNVSPLFLIAFSVIGFLIFSVFNAVFSAKNRAAKECFVTLTFCGKKADFKGIIDSGNSVKDVFSGGSVIIADPSKTCRFFGVLSAEKYPEKYRAVPCKTVSGAELLDGFRCENGEIITKEKTFSLTRPVLALSKAPLTDCEAIVNPEDCD